MAQYETQLTREHKASSKDPQRNMNNRVAGERPLRKQAWLDKQKKKDCGASQ